MSKILLTGGLGYIGSHIIACMEDPKSVLIADNLSNCDLSQIQRCLLYTSRRG